MWAAALKGGREMSNLIRCDPRVYAKCPTRKVCGQVGQAEYFEGSDCDKFAETVLSAPPTCADHIRSMTDEELAKSRVYAVIKDYKAILGNYEYMTNDGTRFDDYEEAVEYELRCLKQPYESEE